MSLEPTPLKPGESYASVADIRDCVDLPTMPITPLVKMFDGTTEPLWRKPDGTPLTILVRAPSFKDAREIDQKSKDDDFAFVLETCHRCITEPKFTPDQITILADKGFAALQQISDAAWRLAELPPGLIESTVRLLAGLEVQSAKRTKKRAVGKRVDTAVDREVSDAGSGA